MREKKPRERLSGIRILSEPKTVDGSDILENDVYWDVFGNSGETNISIWRRLLSSSKNNQFRDDFRLEIVDLETAFEVFAITYLRKKLESRSLRDSTIKWLLFKHNIEQVLKIAFREATGQNISEFAPQLHTRWVNEVKTLRDKIIHKGVLPTADQALVARETVIRFIFKIEPKSIEFFKIQKQNIGGVDIAETFGTYKAKKGEKKVKIETGLPNLHYFLISKGKS